MTRNSKARGDKDTSTENLMNNKILSLIFISFTKLKMPIQNKVLKGKKKRFVSYKFLRVLESVPCLQSYHRQIKVTQH